MADKPQAKNELGQLFVDIGIGGLGKTLKGLNSVAASFLLGKNAANQFVQTIAQPFKEAGNAAVSIGKMSNALATSSMEYQKLAMYLKKYNLSEELLGDVSKLEQTFYDLSQGFTNLQGSLAVGLSQAGLNAKDYKGTFEDTIRLIDDLQRATSGMTKDKRNQILRQIGLSSDWGYLWSKGGRATDYLTISDDAITRNQELSEAMSELGQSLKNFLDEIKSNIAPALTEIAKWATSVLKFFNTNDPKATTALGMTTAGGAGVGLATGAAVGSLFGPIGTGVGALVGVGMGGAAGAASGLAVNKAVKGRATGGAAGVGYMGELPDIGGSEISPNISGLTQNISINHDITINGGDANSIANQIASISVEDIQYTQYQAANLPGI